MVTVWLEDLKIVYGEDHLTLHQWGSKTAKHQLYKTCGIYRSYQKRLNPSEMDVNVVKIEGLHPQDFENIPWVKGINHPSDMRS